MAVEKPGKLRKKFIFYIVAALVLVVILDSQ